MDLLMFAFNSNSNQVTEWFHLQQVNIILSTLFVVFDVMFKLAVTAAFK